jgi:hypothetical protein
MQEDHFGDWTSAAQELFDEHDPSMTEAMAFTVELLRRMKRWHFDCAQNEDDTPFSRAMWQEDFEKLTKAINLLTAVDLSGM